MKHIYILTALLISTAASAQEIAKNDTILTVKNPKNIVITEDKNCVKVAIKGTDTDSTFISTYEEKFSENATITSHQMFVSPWSRDCEGTSTAISNGLMFGFVTAPGMPQTMDVEMSKSFEISWLNMVAVRFSDKAHKNFLSIGMGLDWRNYRSTKGTRFISTDDGGIAFDVYPDGCRPKYSRLKVFSLGFPILYKHSFKNDRHNRSKFSISAGAILNYNSHASLSSSWVNAEGNEVKESTNHIGHNKFTVDLIGIISLNSNFGIYAKYSPMDVLRDTKGPGFKTFSAGFIFAY